ncbi:hypothetical protein CPB97_001479, partial [Podila verticillata]
MKYSTVILALALAVLSVSAAPTGVHMPQPEATQFSDDVEVMGGCLCNPGGP